jgi:hypothetical protein
MLPVHYRGVKADTTAVPWCRLGRADLAGAERRTGRERARPKMGTWSQRRRNVAKGLAANRAKFGAENIGAKPTASLFTSRIDALNGGARH